MPTLFILVIALLIATCVIAYWSDNLGKKLGKKRISLFGLRPRQTATFISMGSSVGIMLLTLGVLLFSNASLRNALTRYDQTKKDNTRLIAMNNDLKLTGTKLQKATRQAEDRAKSAQDKATQAEQQAADARAKREQARAQLQKIRGELAGARRNAQQAQAQAASAQSQFRTAQAGLRTAQSGLRLAQSRVKKAQQELRGKEHQLRNVNSQLRNVQVQIRKTQHELRQSRVELAKSRRAVVNNRRAWESTLTALKDAQKQFALELAKLNEERESLEAERGGLESDVRYLRGQIEELQQETENIRQAKTNLSAGRIEFADRTRFAEQTVPAHSRPDEALAIVRTVLAQAEEVVSGMGRDMVLVRTLPMGSGNAELTYDQLLTLLVGGLSSSPTPIAVRLVAAGYHAEGENPIRVRFFTVEVKTMFPRDAVITSTRIEGKSSDAQIFRKLLDLLKAGESVLLAKPYLASPVLTEDEPNFWPSGTNDRIFEALRQIQAADKTVEVRLVAATDLLTTGPMKIRFEVREESV